MLMPPQALQRLLLPSYQPAAAATTITELLMLCGDVSEKDMDELLIVCGDPPLLPPLDRQHLDLAACSSRLRAKVTM